MPYDTTARLQHWLDRLRGGDPSARHELIRHAQDRLRRLTRHMLRRYPKVRRWEETSDVFQNVLVRLDRALRDVDFVATGLTTPRDLFQLSGQLIRRELRDLIARYFGPHGAGANTVDYLPPDRADPEPDPVAMARWRELHEYIARRPDDERV